MGTLLVSQLLKRKPFGSKRQLWVPIARADGRNISQYNLRIVTHFDQTGVPSKGPLDDGTDLGRARRGSGDYEQPGIEMGRSQDAAEALGPVGQLEPRILSLSGHSFLVVVPHVV